MLTRTGAYLCEQRRAHRLTRGQLAAALGCTNIAKGANRIVHLERDGMAIDGLLDKVVHVLGLDQQHVQELFHEDRRRFEEDWQRWASEPIEPQLRFRPFAGLWCGESLLDRTRAGGAACRAAPYFHDRDRISYPELQVSRSTPGRWSSRRTR